MSYTNIRVCAACGTQNRVSARHLADAGRCGSCSAELPPSSEPINVDLPAFEDIVQSARVPVLIDFWAAWCGPCRTAAPEVHAVAHEMAGKALVLKVDAEKVAELANRFAVRSIPNFVVMRDGRTVLQQPGLVSRDQMRRWLQDAAATKTA